MTIKNPYLLFLGDAADQLAAKTAQGVKDWRPEWCLGQLRMENCNADLGLPDIGLDAAYEKGARTLVIGIANRGGVISDAWTKVLEQALRVGFDLAAGLHGRLVDVPVLRQTAAELGRQLHDVRHPSASFSVASGERRPGKRILAFGTDCSIGKMYTMLAM